MKPLSDMDFTEEENQKFEIFTKKITGKNVKAEKINCLYIVVLLLGKPFGFALSLNWVDI